MSHLQGFALFMNLESVEIGASSVKLGKMKFASVGKNNNALTRK